MNPKPDNTVTFFVNEQPFICKVHGEFTIDVLKDIEDQLMMNRQMIGNTMSQLLHTSVLGKNLN